MPNQRNQAIVAELQAKLEDFRSAVFVDFTGIDVASMQSIRGKLREQQIELQVVKNTLLKIAAKNAGIDFIPDNVLQGQTAIAIGKEDAVAVPKTLVAEAKANEKLQIKAGMTRDKALSLAEVKQLAKLPGKEQLRGQVVGVISSPLRGLVTVLNGNISGLVRVLQAHKENLEKAA